MSVIFLRFGLFLLSCFGICVGLLMIFAELDPTKLCGKSCQTLHALIEIFGKDSVRFVVATLWILGGIWFGYMGIRIKEAERAKD